MRHRLDKVQTRGTLVSLRDNTDKRKPHHPNPVPVVRRWFVRRLPRPAYGLSFFAFRVLLLASSAWRPKLSRSFCCRSPLAESDCLCPLAPDWRTAIARPKDGPRSIAFQFSRRLRAGGLSLARSLCRRWPSCLGTGGISREMTEAVFH